MDRVIGIGMIGIDAENEFQHPLPWSSDREAESVQCFRGSVADPLINSLGGGMSIVRFDVVYVNPTGFDGEVSEGFVDVFTD